MKVPYENISHLSSKMFRPAKHELLQRALLELSPYACSLVEDGDFEALTQHVIRAMDQWLAVRYWDNTPVDHTEIPQ